MSLPDSPQTLSWVLSCYSQTQKELLAHNTLTAVQHIKQWPTGFCRIYLLGVEAPSSYFFVICSLVLCFQDTFGIRLLLFSWWRKDHKPCVLCPRSKVWKLKSYPFILVIVLPLFLCLPLQTPACRGFLPHDLQLDSIIHPCIPFHRTFFCKDFVLLSNQSLKVRSCSLPKVGPKIQFVFSSL